MHYFILLLSISLTFFSASAIAMPVNAKESGQRNLSPPPDYAPDRVLVKFQPGALASEIEHLTNRAGGRSLYVIQGLGVHVIRVPPGTVEHSIGLFKNNPNVIYAEPDLYRVLVIPNEGEDPPPTGTPNQYFNEQWALNNTGQSHTFPDPLLGAVQVTGATDADIDAPEGWDITTGSSNVKIAILDTGIDCRSASLPGGSLEFISTSKCIEETNFVSDYSDTVVDVVAHGTHVAGIAAAATNNDIGIAGVGWNSRVGSLKACFEYWYDLLPPLGYYVIVGICPVSSSAAAITYAADNNYHVINMSYASDEVDENGEPLGLGGRTQTESDAIDYAWNEGVVIVAAAGNNNDSVEGYPAAYDNVIAVGATDRYDDRASFSTFSSDWVSLLAPGENIISTVPNDLCVFYADLLGFFFDPDSDACLDWYSGTSMASPHVAGAAALVWAHLFPDDQLADPSSCEMAPDVKCNQAVRQHLEDGADTEGALGQNMLAWSEHGRLNVVGALTVVTSPIQAPIIRSLTDNTDGTVTVLWDYTGSIHLQREKLHAKRGVWQSLTTVLSGSPEIPSYTDDSGAGTFHYRVGATLPDNSVIWGDWSPDTDVTDSGSVKGGGKGGGKPNK